jgi:hypothetical protein
MSGVVVIYQQFRKKSRNFYPSRRRDFHAIVKIIRVFILNLIIVIIKIIRVYRSDFKLHVILIDVRFSSESRRRQVVKH